MRDEAEMLALGAQLAAVCEEKVIIFLHGQLGAGKTTFARGFLRGLGYQGLVKSPTYPLVESYELKNRLVFHFDFYRVHAADELEAIGIRDYFSTNAICLIEWPEQGIAVLPKADLSYYIQLCANGREIKLIAHSVQGKTILQRLKV